MDHSIAIRPLKGESRDTVLHHPRVIAQIISLCPGLEQIVLEHESNIAQAFQSS